ncbi:MAG: hypothetical protein A4E39_00380 [Methanoregulaceae archaeon PtaB.Bin152]|nr:MAG: hypothetical protein A4E39_00380 [Methanoregulaceae archaeon PtaB.Bin152]
MRGVAQFPSALPGKPQKPDYLSQLLLRGSVREMRARAVYAFLVKSIAFNIVLGAALVSLFIAPGVLLPGTRVGGDLSCDDCRELLSDFNQGRV